jgi:hypothetical protein
MGLQFKLTDRLLLAIIALSLDGTAVAAPADGDGVVAEDFTGAAETTFLLRTGVFVGATTGGRVTAGVLDAGEL